MDNIQRAQGLEYGFKSEAVGNLSNYDAVRLMKLRDYAATLGLVVLSHPNGVHIQIQDDLTREPIAKIISL